MLRREAPAPARPGLVILEAPAPARPGLVILDFKPAMDDLMTMLVQPRHIRLYYAGQAQNWRLAAFQVNELRGALARIGRTIPNYRNINVDTAVAAIFAEKLKAVEAAVKAADLTEPAGLGPGDVEAPDDAGLHPARPDSRPWHSATGSAHRPRAVAAKSRPERQRRLPKRQTGLVRYQRTKGTRASARL